MCKLNRQNASNCPQNDREMAIFWPSSFSTTQPGHLVVRGNRPGMLPESALAPLCAPEMKAAPRWFSMILAAGVPVSVCIMRGRGTESNLVPEVLGCPLGFSITSPIFWHLAASRCRECDLVIAWSPSSRITWAAIDAALALSQKHARLQANSWHHFVGPLYGLLTFTDERWIVSMGTIGCQTAIAA